MTAWMDEWFAGCSVVCSNGHWPIISNAADDVDVAAAVDVVVVLANMVNSHLYTKLTIYDLFFLLLLFFFLCFFFHFLILPPTVRIFPLFMISLCVYWNTSRLLCTKCGHWSHSISQADRQTVRRTDR